MDVLASLVIVGEEKFLFLYKAKDSLKAIRRSLDVAMDDRFPTFRMPQAAEMAANIRQTLEALYLTDCEGR